MMFPLYVFRFLRMELFGEKRTKLLSKLVSGSVQSIDSQSFVSHIPGIEAYGVSYLLSETFRF